VETARSSCISAIYYIARIAFTCWGIQSRVCLLSIREVGSGGQLEVGGGLLPSTLVELKQMDLCSSSTFTHIKTHRKGKAI